VSAAGVANTTLGAREIWQFLLDLRAKEIQAVFPHTCPSTSRRPRATPWTAFYLMPQFISGADLRSVRQVLELHKTIGWAVIDHISGQQSRN
jgi:hypothetical protein